jgi:Holliday junction resolvase
MRRVGQSRRRDLNEPGIVQALRKAGALVIRISEKGAPDLLCFYRGRVVLLECKSHVGRATEAQEETSQAGWPVVTVRDAIAALRAVGAVA